MQIRKFIRTKILENLFENDNKFIYHGTHKGAALNIQKDGYMKLNKTGEKYPSISFTDDLNYAKYYAKSKGGIDRMVILRTLLDEKFKLSPRIKNNKGDEYISFLKIPVNELEILTIDGNWKPLGKWNVIFDELLTENKLLNKLDKSFGEKLQEDTHSDYLKWKRKNVTLRGIKELDKPNEVYGSFGNGLYTVLLGNKAMAKQYGEVYFVVNAMPKNPKIVDSLNNAELLRQTLVNNYCKKNNVDYSVKYFNDNTTMEKEMLNIGYDGLIIRGREMVNYNLNVAQI